MKVQDANQEVNMKQQACDVAKIPATLGYDLHFTETSSRKLSYKRTILHFNDAPTWMRIDPYIKKGYRNELSSIFRCFMSLFYPHNELVNAWSHFGPGVVYLLILLTADYSLLRDPATFNKGVDILMVQFYVASAAACLIFSGIYHTLSAHSERVCQHSLKLDYLGIVLNIVTTCVTSTWFGLYEYPNLRLGYITASLSFAVGVFIIFLSPEADGPRAEIWRSLLLISLAGSGYAPILHSWLMSGVDGLLSFPFVPSMAMGIIYLVGVVFYLTHFPESKYPKTFDILGASHQIFHLTVALGQVIYLQGLRNITHQRHAIT